MIPPKWAQDLTVNAILFLQSKGLDAELPELHWRHGASQQSSGHASWDNQALHRKEVLHNK